MRYLYSHHEKHSSSLMLPDARVKLSLAIALLVMVISSRGIGFPLLVTVAGVAVILSLGVRPRVFVTRFAGPLLIAVMILLLKAFMTGHLPLFRISFLGMEMVCCKEGLLEGVRIASRIMAGVTVVAAAGFATPFTEMLGALAWFRVPRGLIDVTIFAWRYLFVLADDAQVIHAAQRNRLGYVGLVRGCRSFGTLSGALVIKAFDSSQTMTTAMVQRGYDGSLPLFRHRPFRRVELGVALLIVTVMGVLWQM